MNRLRLSPQNASHLSGRAVAEPDPDYLRWMPKNKAHLVKVRVLGDDREVMTGSVGPDTPVVGRLEIDITDVTGPREEILDYLNQSG